MKKSLFLLATWIFVSCAFVFVAIYDFPLVHINKVIFFNTTASMPKGFYVVSHETLRPGGLVVIESAKIKSNTIRQLPKYLLKRLIAYHGELVTINNEGLFMDGKLSAKKLISSGVSFNSVLSLGQALILGDSERSYDSRYFGPVEVSDLIPVRPFVTW